MQGVQCGRPVSINHLCRWGGQEVKILEPCLYQKPRGNNDGGLIENISPTMTSNSWQENVLLCEPSGVYTECSPEFQRKPLPGMSRTLKAVKHDSGVLEGGRIRKLTPLECFRLMGFDDADHAKAVAAGVSNSQLYKQAGNSIVVDVLEAIFRQLF